MALSFTLITYVLSLFEIVISSKNPVSYNFLRVLFRLACEILSLKYDFMVSVSILLFPTTSKLALNAYEYVLEALYKQTKDPAMCLETIDNWMWWIFKYLPFDYVLNIVDSFLLEGKKLFL